MNNKQITSKLKLTIYMTKEDFSLLESIVSDRKKAGDRKASYSAVLAEALQHYHKR